MSVHKIQPEVIIKNLKAGKHNLVMSLPMPLVLELRNAMLYVAGQNEHRMWGHVWFPERTLLECNSRLLMGY